jgi:hypothetical protein
MIFQAISVIRNDGEKSAASSGKAHRGIGSCTNLVRIMKIFLECPKFLGIHENYLQNIFFEQNKNSQNAKKKFKH